MKLIINIPKVFYEALRKTDAIISGQRSGKTLMSVIFDAVANGIPIPDNATNGDVMKAIFPNEYDFETDFDEEWWNSPYQKGGKE